MILRKDMETVPSMVIGSTQCSRRDLTLMIAEEGQANDGNFDLAPKMIDIASDSGADGIEFQLGIAADLYVSSHEGYTIYKKREFTPTIIQELIAATHSKNMFFHAACLSDKLVDMVSELGADVIVVNAMDLNNPRMLDAVSACGKPFLISTLMGTLEEIDWAVLRVNNRGAKNFGLLHGQHIMASNEGGAVPVEYAQLDCMAMMEQRYGLPVGFVDHTNSEIMPAIASGRGAALVTKHLSPSFGWQGPDWQVCLDPDAWKRANSYVRYANAARGANKTLSLEEVRDRSLQRRSIVAAKDIPKGKVLEDDDICFKRPGGGLDPRNSEEYIGRRVKRSVLVDLLITEDIFEKV